MTLTEIFSRLPAGSPAWDHPALILPPSSPHAGNAPLHISYAHLQHLVQGVQAQLAALGLKVGDVVSSSLGNGVEFAVAFLATGAQR